jgi:hypothetical protein
MKSYGSNRDFYEKNEVLNEIFSAEKSVFKRNLMVGTGNFFYKPT